jgi:hypothetical protein
MGCIARVHFPPGARDLSPQHIYRSRVHPASFAVDAVGSFPGHEADHSHLPSGEVSNGGVVPSHPHTFSWPGA